MRFIGAIPAFFLAIAAAAYSPVSALAGNCGACQKPGISQNCSGCRTAYYCSSECQKSHWGTHKATCKSLAPYKDLEGGVVIGASLIPGACNGLIAKKAFLRGEAVAVYFGERLNPPQKTCFGFQDGVYLQNLPDGTYINGAKHPPRPHLGAQIANDPYVSSDQIIQLKAVDCASASPEYLNSIRQFTVQYYSNLIAAPRHNVDLRLPESGATQLPVFRASTVIHPGSEILYSYGYEYWVTIPMRICSKKGYPETSLQIQRAASRGLEEVVARFGSENSLVKKFLIDENTGYLTQAQAEENLEILAKSFPLRLEHLFGNPGSLGVRSYKDKTHPLDRFFEGLKAELQIDERIEEIRRAQNEEFYSEDFNSKPHPKAKALIQDIAKFMKEEIKNEVSWYVQRSTLEDVSWQQILDGLE